MAVTTPPPLTLPGLSPDRSDRTTFTARSIARDDYIKNTQVPQLILALANIAANATDAASNGTAAAASQVASAASQVAAASSATSAATNQGSVQTLTSAFNVLYLGAKSSDPTLDNSGAALVSGAFYTNTASNTIRAYTVSGGWFTGISALAGVSSVNGSTGAVTVQPTLVSGTNIKSISGVSLLGTGNLVIGSSLIRSARTANTVLAVADNSTLIDITSGTFTQTFTAAATLGSGWFVYFRNSGTGDITVDPNAAELIDGLTSYIIYPGEARLVQCDGTAFNSVVVRPFYRTFILSSTFTKPPGYSLFGGLAWGGGSSGDHALNNTTAGGGGGGGGCFDFRLVSASVGATENVLIGSGGAGLTAINTTAALGGSTSMGVLLSVSGGQGNNGGSVTQLVGATTGAFGYEGASTSSPSTATLSSVWGGAAGRQSGGLSSGNSIYGGAAGGNLTTTAAVNAPGTSLFGGNGGAAVSGSAGAAGTAPGGGGGATQAAAGIASGAGARGELRIWGII